MLPSRITHPLSAALLAVTAALVLVASLLAINGTASWLAERFLGRRTTA